jgi:ring-1,2-phenylacetyl-CoA epoxidase subunit PaaD
VVSAAVIASANRGVDAVWRLLETIPDPEIPVISICDLGIVREVRAGADGAPSEVVITPTYSGCPAMQAIEDDIRGKLAAQGISGVRITTTLTPAWTSDWMSAAGRARLTEYGIAPPAHGAAKPNVAVIRFVTHRHAGPTCPRCGSADTERLSEFGSTACKALYRCLECREPFDYFKPI